MVQVKKILAMSVCCLLTVPAVADFKLATAYNAGSPSPFDGALEAYMQGKEVKRKNLEMERMKLENELLRLEVQKAKQLQQNTDIADNDETDAL